MSRPLPMLAKPLPAKLAITPGAFVVEEKYDGHRILVEVRKLDKNPTLLSEHDGYKDVFAWSRNNNERILHAQLADELRLLPEGIYDGELVIPGGHSYDVTRKTDLGKRVLMLFDVLQCAGTELTDQTFHVRREVLETVIKHVPQTFVRLAKQIAVQTREEIDQAAELIWQQEGEGIIVKRWEAKYTPGKRTDAFMKLKECGTGVLTIIGWAPSKGEVIDRGPFAVALLRDDEGNETRVKVLNDETLERIRVAAIAAGRQPWLGRKLRIDFHQRTPSGSYRHPRWDRLEDE